MVGGGREERRKGRRDREIKEEGEEKGKTTTHVLPGGV